MAVEEEGGASRRAPRFANRGVARQQWRARLRPPRQQQYS